MKLPLAIHSLIHHLCMLAFKFYHKGAAMDALMIYAVAFNLSTWLFNHQPINYD